MKEQLSLHDEITGLAAIFVRDRDAFRALKCERPDYLARESKLQAYKILIDSGLSPAQAVETFKIYLSAEHP